MTGRVRTLLLGAAALVVAAFVLTQVMSGADVEEADRPAPPTTTPEPEPPAMAPLDLSDSPLWTKEDSWVARNITSGAQVRDGVVLTMTTDTLELVDLATGKTRWSPRSKLGARWVLRGSELNRTR
jgi:hypothetical protein